jgi:hypothetical protein
MTAETLPELDGRHQLFETVRRAADWTVNELWIAYVTLGGMLHVTDLERYLSGSMPMPPGQQDVLAHALNERFADLSAEVRVPYVTPLPDHCEHALTMLEDRPASSPGHRSRGLQLVPRALHPPHDRTRDADHCGPGRELIFERF